MAPEELLERLPANHVAALCLRAGGIDDLDIAVTLGIDPEAVEPLLRVARAKLRHAVAATDEAG